MRSKGLERAALIILILLSLLCVVPLILVVTSSFTSEKALYLYGYSLFPSEISLDAYRYLLTSKDQLLRAYLLSFVVTFAGTACSILITTLLAYPLSKPELPGRGFFSFFIFFTMLFNGGLIPTYLVYSQTFHIKDTIWALIVPGLLMNGFSVILVRTYLTTNIPREILDAGEIDGASISFFNTSSETSCVRYNKGIASEYLKYLNEMKEDFGLDYDIRVSTLSRFPDVFTTEEEEPDEDQIWGEFEPVMRKALEEIRQTREREGEDLRRDLLGKLDELKEEVGFIEKRSPEIMENYRNRLTERVREMLNDAAIDESRIVTEVTIFSDKVCVDEELTRLKSHIDSMRKELEKGGAVGRKLDFIAQEMNREANTTLSKANDILTSDSAIEIKTGIEKIREQIQNIE